MAAKLTIKLDKKIMKKAKKYAKVCHMSLSGLIVNHLKKITKENREEIKITPYVKNLLGALNINEDHDHRKDYADFLSTKTKK